MLRRIRERFGRVEGNTSSNIQVFNEPELGIDFASVFGREYSVEQWENIFCENEETTRYEDIEEVVGKLLSKGLNGRNLIIDTLSSPRKKTYTSRDANTEHEHRQKWRQHLIDLSSLSERNLKNIQQAARNLQQKS